MNNNFNTQLERFPRYQLLETQTPIQKLSRLERSSDVVLNGVNLYVKRDDYMSLGGGGNKLRKLEFLIGAALADNADTIITIGGLQSNHARLTAAAAAYAGLRCELFLGRQVPRDDPDYERNGNTVLNEIFGARVYDLIAGADVLKRAQERAEALRSAGRRVYVAPTGGSTPTGSLGYVHCAQEILQQSAELGVSFDQIVVPNGSSGTHAGLAAGYILAGKSAATVKSYATLADQATAFQKTRTLVEDTLKLLECDVIVDGESILVDDAFRGPGYGIPTEEMRRAVKILARTEGLLLDPVYSGKAFAGLLADIAAGKYTAGQNILFVMTGGTPGLYAYRSVFEPTLF